MRAIRQSGSEGGAAGVTTGRPYPYQLPYMRSSPWFAPSRAPAHRAGGARWLTLVDRVLADDTVAREMSASGNRVISAALDERREAGLEEGARASLLRVPSRRGFALSDAQRERVPRRRSSTTLASHAVRSAAAALRSLR